MSSLLIYYLIIHVLGIVPTYIAVSRFVRYVSDKEWTVRDRIVNMLYSIIFSVIILGLFLVIGGFFSIIFGILWVITRLSDMIDWDKPVNW